MREEWASSVFRNERQVGESYQQLWVVVHRVQGLRGLRDSRRGREYLIGRWCGLEAHLRMHLCSVMDVIGDGIAIVSIRELPSI